MFSDKTSIDKILKYATEYFVDDVYHELYKYHFNKGDKVSMHHKHLRHLAIEV